MAPRLRGAMGRKFVKESQNPALKRGVDGKQQ
jgi:hypothetical protein